MRFQQPLWIYLYRFIMRLSHRFGWHYAPIIGPLEPGGGYQQWCKWCGLRSAYYKPFSLNFNDIPMPDSVVSTGKWVAYKIKEKS